MSSEPTQTAPERICQRCGAAVPAIHETCPFCLVADLKMAADHYFDPGPGFSGRLGGSDFTIVEEIGHGGMGVVYRARQTSPARDVAIKVLQPHHAASPDIQKRLFAEAAAMAELNHPGILPLYASGEHNGQPWLAMKLAAGGTLSARRNEWVGRWRPVAELVAGLADAVQHAHERGLIHRDVKPGNVLFDENGRACLSDFGLVKWQNREASDTLSHAMLGTPAYLAPEVARFGARSATTASDIYGLGAILYELLTGAPPFKGAATAELLRRIATEEPPPPRGSNPDIPADLEVICQKGLFKEPAARYPTAADMAADLRRWLDGKTILARRFSTAERMLRWAKRNPLPASLAAALTVALAGGSAALWLKNEDLRATIVKRDLAVIEAEKARGSAEERVAFMTSQLPEMLEPLGQLEVLDGVFEDIDRYYRGPGALNDATGLARQATFRTQWAQVLRPQGRRREARDQLDLAVQCAARSTAMSDANADAWVAHVAALRRRGEHATTEDDHENAVRFIQESIRTADAGLRLFPGSIPLRVERADALFELTYATFERRNPGDLEFGLSTIDAALKEWPVLVTETLSGFAALHTRARRQLAISYFQKGRVCLSLNDRETALESFKESYAVRSALAKDYPRNALEKYFLCSACNRVGDALLEYADDQKDTGLLDEVERYFQEAETLSTELVELNSANQVWRSEWGLSSLAMARLAHLRDDEEGSRAELEKTIKRLSPVSLSAVRYVYEARTFALHRLAKSLAGAGKEAEGLARGKEGLEAGFEDLRANPSRWSGFSRWEEDLRTTIKWQHDLKETDAVIEAGLKEWLARIETEANHTGASSWWSRAAASVHRRLAGLYKIQHRMDEARAANRKAFELRSDLLEKELRAGGDLVDDIAAAAKSFLECVPTEADRKDIVLRIARCAARAAVLRPDDRWRPEWTEVVAGAIGLLDQAARAPLARKARTALYPDAFIREWTGGEATSLEKLRGLETAN